MIIVNNNQGIEIGSNGEIFSNIPPAPTTNYTPTVNTMVYWPLDTTEITDFSGNNYGGTNTNATLETTGAKFNAYHRLLAVNTPNIVGTTNLPFSTDYMFSAWRRRITNDDGWPGFVSCGHDNVDSNIGFGESAQGINSGSISVISVANNYDSVDAHPNDVWCHYLISYQGSTDTMGVYVNGVQIGLTVPYGHVPTVREDPLWVGGGTGMPLGGYRDFEVCEVIIEDKYWTQEDVTAYYTPRA